MSTVRNAVREGQNNRKESNGRMKVVKSSVVAAVLGLAMSVSAAAALAATPAFPQFTGPPSKTNPVVKPSEIVYSGDGSHLFAGGGKKIGKLHWTKWNGSEGLGTGYNWEDNCTPDCARGKFSKYPVTLKVYRPEKVSKYFIFTRLKVTYTGKRPGKQKSFTWDVSYKRGIFLIG